MDKRCTKINTLRPYNIWNYLNCSLYIFQLYYSPISSLLNSVSSSILPFAKHLFPDSLISSRFFFKTFSLNPSSRPSWTKVMSPFSEIIFLVSPNKARWSHNCLHAWHENQNRGYGNYYSFLQRRISIHPIDLLRTITITKCVQLQSYIHSPFSRNCSYHPLYLQPYSPHISEMNYWVAVFVIVPLCGCGTDLSSVQGYEEVKYKCQLKKLLQSGITLVISELFRSGVLLQRPSNGIYLGHSFNCWMKDCNFEHRM